jgi:glycoprotein endo-alpha-1,2-mannosidase
LLRRLLVVGLGTVCFCMPAAARAAPAAGGGGLLGRAPAALPAALPVTVAIFYYPWYSTPAVDGAWEHWDQNGHSPPTDVYSRYYPALGPYSSDDPAVVDLQMAEISTAGVDEIVVSWWGRGSDEDRRLPLVLAAAQRHHLRVAIHLEPYGGRSPVTVAGDLAYIASLGIRDVYVYHPGDLAASDWAALHAGQPELRLLAGTERVGFAAAGRFDGFYTYDFVTYRGDKFLRLCLQAHALHLLCAPSVGPGYDGRRAGESPAGRPRRNGLTYDGLWAAALAASPDVVTITSFNEWGEGTQIEPARSRSGYAGYNGAWGMRGAPAQTAYLWRTAYWAGLAHAGLRR